MTLRRAVWTLVRAAAAGLVLGAIFSGDELVSVEVWVGATAVSLLALMVGDLLTNSALEPATMTPAWARADDQGARLQPRELQNLRSLVVSAQSNPRAFSRQLRTSLIDLAGHFLPRRHGIEPGTDPRLMADLLGDTAWLIDPSVEDRAPTGEDLERFLAIVMGAEPSGPSRGDEGP